MVSGEEMAIPEIRTHDAIEEDDEEEEDETLTERLIGLTEMFPKPIRNFTYSFGTGLYSCIKGFYSLSCSATWILASSSAILFAPLIFEIERAQMEEAQRNQQKQVLLGPNTAMSHMNTPGMPAPPPIHR